MIIAIHSKPKIRWLFSFHLHISWCSPTFFSFAARNLLFYHSMETHKTELDEKTIQLDKKNRKNETGRRMNRNSCTVENNGLNDSYVNNNDKQIFARVMIRQCDHHYFLFKKHTTRYKQHSNPQASSSALYLYYVCALLFIQLLLLCFFPFASKCASKTIHQ